MDISGKGRVEGLGNLKDEFPREETKEGKEEYEPGR